MPPASCPLPPAASLRPAVLTPPCSVLIGTFTIVDKIPPFHQPFSLDNYSLHYPFAKKERVPVPWLCVYVVFAPAVIIGLYTMVIDGLFSHQTDLPTGRAGIKRLTGRYRFKDRLWELNCGTLTAVAVTAGASDGTYTEVSGTTLA